MKPGAVAKLRCPVEEQLGCRVAGEPRATLGLLPLLVTPAPTGGARVLLNRGVHIPTSSQSSLQLQYSVWVWEGVKMLFKNLQGLSSLRIGILVILTLGGQRG